MKSKFYFKWFFGIVLMLGLFVTNAQAQLAVPPQERDSTVLDNRTDRATFNSWDLIIQKNFLLTPGFVIYDIINAEPHNYLNPAEPNQYYITEWDFYHAILDKQLEILHKPTTWIVFPDNISE